MSSTYKPDKTYVFRRLEHLRELQRPWHMKMKEIEELRYFEDKISVGEHQIHTGLEIRTGLTAELIESFKAAMSANLPAIEVEPLKTTDDARENSSKREHFWQAWIATRQAPNHLWADFIDSMGGLGVGIFKASKVVWPIEERLKKIKGESTSERRERLRALKRMWGPPFGGINLHPMSCFFEPGVNNEVEELIEHSWKPKAAIYGQYELDSHKVPNLRDSNLRAYSGMPEQFVKPHAVGVDTRTMALVTEYYLKDQWYQVYVNGRMVYEEENPSVKYILGLGRTNTSQDPDKFGISIAEFLRQNERTINRMMTLMAEAVELVVRKRLTLELPEGGIAETTTDEDGNVSAKTYQFTPDYAEALPPGSEIKDPFAGAEAAFGALPLINLMLQFVGQHGISPIFKGVPAGAAGSGYRDNSLYIMAMSQFAYLLMTFNEAVRQLIEFQEWLLVHHIKQEIWCGNNSLTPADIEKFPARIKITTEPNIPQNLIAEGAFWDRMAAQGRVSTRFVREKLGIEAPEEMQKEVDLEKLKEAAFPLLLQDVLAYVFRQPASPQGGGLVGPDGVSPISTQGGPGGVQRQLTSGQGGQGPGRGLGQEMGGFGTQGQPKQPQTQPGATR